MNICLFNAKICEQWNIKQMEGGNNSSTDFKYDFWAAK